MNADDSSEERPLAWMAILQHTPVYASDGTEIGRTADVLGAEDIFHGVVVHSGPSGHDVVIPGADVSNITNRRIDVSLTPEEARVLPPYRPEETYRLGIVGLFR